jgi:PfaB family protein
MPLAHAAISGPNPTRPPSTAQESSITGESGRRRLVARPRVFSGADVHAALASLAAGRESDQGPARLVVLAASADQFVARAAAARDWLLAGGRQPEGVWFRATPLAGDVGFVFAGGSMAYPGMGEGLRSAFPSLLASVAASSGSPESIAGWESGRAGGGRPRHVLDQIVGAALLGSVHARVTRDLLRITPQAVLGYSSGEFSACVAMLWPDVAAIVDQSRSSELWTRGLTGQHDVVRRAWRRAGIDGDWASYNVMSTAAEVRAALAGEPAVHLMVVNAPRSCVIGGEASGCQRVLGRLNSYAVPIDYDVTVHVPELAEVREQIWQLYHRPVRPIPGVRFYSCSADGPYVPTPETVADAICGMLLETVDFPRLVQRAWADGVRVFIEHGPGGQCRKWIGRILGDREHLVVSLDARDGQKVPQLSRAVAELLAAGVTVAADRLYDYLDGAPDYLDGAQPPAAPASPPAIEALGATEALGAILPAALTSQWPGIAARQQDFLVLLAETQRRFLRSQQNAEAALLAARTAFCSRGMQVPAALPAASPTRPGPRLDRAQLESLPRGPVGAELDTRSTGRQARSRRIRLPQPPLLLIDRVTGIDTTPSSAGEGTVWSETDVRLDSWYLDAAGRMPAGIVAEAGQALLLLLGRLGVDLRGGAGGRCRFLGAELTYHGSPPTPGETLSYETRVDGHSEHDGVGLVSFHADCHVDGQRRLTVRNGQAGIFADDLPTSSPGLVWDPEDEIPEELSADPPAIQCSRHAFGPAAVQAFADGRPHDCFGTGWEQTRAHVRTPRIAGGRMLYLHEVMEFAPHGGPWGRGYLRAERPVAPDDWFFASHFPGDPCMPATLMFEGGLQAMSFYLAAMGYTAERDGWRFEPVPDNTFRMRCRGEVTPASHRLTYEVFVTEVSAGPQPTVFADVLCTVDGVRALHARRVGLRLVPDWPLEQWRRLPSAARQATGELALTAPGSAGDGQPTRVAVVDGFRFDYASLLAWAWGRPSEAFGPSYARFDGTRSAPRMPGPPYHFISRIVSVDGPMGGMQTGSRVEAEYDLPAEAWYWQHNGCPVMPLAVLMEVALQPCGWLGAYVGSTLRTGTDLLFRNLGGQGTVTAEIGPGTRTLRTRAALTEVAQSAGMIIESFEVDCYAGDTPVFTLSTVFGYFPKEAFDRQVGFPVSAAERARLTEPSSYTVDLAARPARYCEGPMRLAGPMLLMIDRVTGYWPDGGLAGLGRLRAERDVDPDEWYFKAHFFRDPVQPGSLGIEAMVQLLQYYMVERGMGVGLHRPRFEPVRLGEQFSWAYRGQVVPTNSRITVELEVLEVGVDDRGRYAVAEGWLWVDGVQVYHAERIGMRVVPGESSREVERS